MKEFTDEEGNKIMDDTRDFLYKECKGDVIEMTSILTGILGGCFAALRNKNGKEIEIIIDGILEEIKNSYKKGSNEHNPTL